jgi:hypothetical protein
LDGTTLSIELATVATTGNYEDLTNKPHGNGPGDLQYWNGTNWIILQVGTEGQVLTVVPNNTLIWGNSTPPPAVFPTVVTNPATNIAKTEADLNGTITAGSEPILSKGFANTASGTFYGAEIPFTTLPQFIGDPVIDIDGNEYPIDHLERCGWSSI